MWILEFQGMWKEELEDYERVCILALIMANKGIVVTIKGGPIVIKG